MKHAPIIEITVEKAFVDSWYSLCMSILLQLLRPLRARFTGPTWGPPGPCRPQMTPMWAPWTLLSGTAITCLPSAPLAKQSIGHWVSLRSSSHGLVKRPGNSQTLRRWISHRKEDRTLLIDTNAIIHYMRVWMVALNTLCVFVILVHAFDI